MLPGRWRPSGNEVESERGLNDGGDAGMAAEVLKGWRVVLVQEWRGASVTVGLVGVMGALLGRWRVSHGALGLSGTLDAALVTKAGARELNERERGENTSVSTSNDATLSKLLVLITSNLTFCMIMFWCAMIRLKNTVWNLINICEFEFICMVKKKWFTVIYTWTSISISNAEANWKSKGSN